MNEKKETTSRLQIKGSKYLCRDAYCMWIARRKVTGGKEFYERITGYYSTFEALMEGYARENARRVQGDTVTECLNNLIALERDLREMGRKIGKELDKKEAGK